MRDPLTAVVAASAAAAAAGGTRPRSLDSPVLAALGRPLRSWRGNWVVGEDMYPAAHSLTRAGAVGGRLSLHADAVSFAASRMEICCGTNRRS